MGFNTQALAQSSLALKNDVPPTPARVEALDDIEAQLSLFKKSFTQAKEAWAAAIFQLQKINPNIQVGHYDVLFGMERIPVDFLFLPGKNPTNLLILNSGTHGVEAHAGSAVELLFLQRIMKSKKANSYSILVIHGLNAYGFKYNRRVNENNVDLNRNFVKDKKIFSEKNDGYEQIQGFLNPPVALELGFFSRFGFLAKAANMILTYSMESLRRAVLKGQYFLPNGIFFGGNHHEPEVEIFDRILSPYTKTATKIFFVDLHTGYGERNKLHLLSNDENDPGIKKIESIFAPDLIDFGSNKNFYKVTGDVTNYFLSNYKTSSNDVAAITFEFGTLDSQKPLGSIESLRRMVYENQLFHNGTASKAVTNEVQELFLELFYPSNQKWRIRVIEQANEKFEKIEKYFESPK